jgi:hypothetical protein
MSLFCPHPLLFPHLAGPSSKVPYLVKYELLSLLPHSPMCPWVISDSSSNVIYTERARHPPPSQNILSPDPTWWLVTSQLSLTLLSSLL